MSLVDRIRAAGLWDEGYCIQQDPEELAELVRCLRDYVPWGNYLGIGTASGGVERIICHEAMFKDFYIIDNGQHPNFKVWEENKKGIQAHPDSCFVDEFIGDSHSQGAKDFLERWFSDQKLTCVGIDGDHSPQGVAQDWELIQPYLAPGALVFFHDILIDIPGQHGARKLWSRLKHEYDVLLETNGKFGVGCIRTQGAL